MKNDFSLKLLHGINGSTSHGVHDIIIYNTSLIFLNFPFVFKISLFLLEFMNRFHN